MNGKEGDITLYHGTRGPVAYRVQGGEDIIKNMDPSRPGGPTGSLTDNANTAYNFAAFPPSRQVGRLPGPAVIEYKIPKGLVVDHGTISGYGGSHEFSTRDIIPPEEVPEEYLASIRLTREKAIREVRSGHLSFYRIPARFMTKITRY